MITSFLRIERANQDFYNKTQTFENGALFLIQKGNKEYLCLTGGLARVQGQPAVPCPLA